MNPKAPVGAPCRKDQSRRTEVWSLVGDNLRITQHYPHQPNSSDALIEPGAIRLVAASVKEGCIHWCFNGSLESQRDRARHDPPGEQHPRRLTRLVTEYFSGSCGYTRLL
jgi:hypothetical protein